MTLLTMTVKGSSQEKMSLALCYVARANINRDHQNKICGNGEICGVKAALDNIRQEGGKQTLAGEDWKVQVVAILESWKKFCQ